MLFQARELGYKVMSSTHCIGFPKVDTIFRDIITHFYLKKLKTS